MPPPRVRADHDTLKQIAANFGVEAKASRRSLQQLQRQTDVLRGGDWVGQGANAFYQEMSTVILPAFQRLADALESAQQTTGQIGQLIQQAEADAARVLRGEMDAAEAASEDGGVGVAGGLAPAGGPAGAGLAFIPTLRPPNPRTIRQAQARHTAAAQNAAVDKLLSIFDPQVRDLVKQSPTLRAQMLALQQKKIMFLTGPRSQTIEPFITIEQSLTGPDAVAMIAHETGHAISRDKQIERIVETPSMTRDEYVRLNVANHLRNEAMAQFNALQVRAELLAAGAGEIGVPGEQDARFQQVYTEYAAGRITQDQAIDRMAPVMGDMRVPNMSDVLPEVVPPPQTYRDYAIAHFRRDWDTHIAPTRRP